LSHKLRELIAEHNERVDAEVRRRVQAAREGELIEKEFPAYWDGLESAMRQDCEEESEGILHFSQGSSDSQIRIVSELGWLEVLISQEAGTKEIVARCRTYHFRPLETPLWTKRFRAVYFHGGASMAPAEQESAGSVLLHSPSGLSEELLCALIRSA
jgi:hypothetical protein